MGKKTALSVKLCGGEAGAQFVPEALDIYSQPLPWVVSRDRMKKVMITGHVNEVA